MATPEKEKDPIRVANGQLTPNPRAKQKSSNNAYADARTELAKAQTRRYRQIERIAARELLEVGEVRRLVVDSGAAVRERLLATEKQGRARFPGVPQEVFDWLAEAHREALGLISADILKGGPGP